MNAIESFAKNDMVMAFVIAGALVIAGAAIALKAGKVWGWLLVAAGGGFGFMILRWKGLV